MFDLQAKQNANVCFEGLNISCAVSNRPLPIDLAMNIIMFGAVALTVGGNLLVIVSITHFKQLHTPTNFLILSLAVVDFLLGLLVMPYSLVRSLTSCWYFGEMFCKLHSCIDITLCTSSIFHLFFISVDRYFAVCHPLHYYRKITISVVEVCLLISWTIPCVYSFGLVFSNANMEGLQGSEPPPDCCDSCSLVFNKLWSIITSFFCFFFPGSLMIGIYLRVFSVAKKQAKAINNHSNSTSEKNNTKNRMSIKVESKAARTLSLVMGVFILCWMPFFVTTIADPYLNFSVSVDFYNVVLWLGYFNSALDPIIYALFYPWFKKSFRIILSGKILHIGSSSINVLAEP
ncbi:PREDICTED: trace amine-associated receptor 4-like [Nanorana parkeri]|uniref:trace amine-associated receptor 4-like n=1 Tax=Nanorana parkeri TaxID=125878 RepID=UPI00085484DB|nr:PREDICTED: trace amine-associated receptor 4-like [Nanorana parkeri]